MTTPKLGIPELSVSQAGKEITHNQALAVIDQTVHLSVVDKDLATPPGSPANGAAYIVAAAATGAWSGKTGQIAFWLTSAAAWSFVVPNEGWLAWVDDENAHYRLEAGAWIKLVFGGGNGAAVQSFTGALTLTPADAGTYNVSQDATAQTVTIAPEASGAWPTSAEIYIEQGGTARPKIVAGAGVTINKKTNVGAGPLERYAVAKLKRTAANVWTLSGELAPPPAPATLRSAAYTAGLGTSIDATLPAGYAAGDLLVAVLNYGTDSASLNMPAGWTSLASGSHGSNYRVIYKIATGTEGATLSVTAPYSYGLVAHIYAYTTGTYEGIPTALDAVGASGPGADALPTVTPSYGDAAYSVIAGLVGNGGQTASGWPFASNQVNTASTGTTGISGTQANIGLCTGTMSGASLSPGNITNSVFANWSKLTIAVKGIG